MADPLRLMCILAHPDDESLGMGGILAKYAAEGIETYLITATRGERGWTGAEKDYPGPQALGKLREGELRAAAEILGVREVCFLGYTDGDLDQADPADAVARIVTHIRRIRPHVVVSFAPDGAYGHPDHIAISQLTSAALVCAAHPAYSDSGAPHSVSKFYYRIITQAEADLYQAIFGSLEMAVDGVVRRPNVWPEWSVSAWVQAGGYAVVVQQAMACHQSQIPAYGQISGLLEHYGRELCNLQTYYRAYSLVNGGRAVERDLFEGLR